MNLHSVCNMAKQYAVFSCHRRKRRKLPAKHLFENVIAIYIFHGVLDFCSQRFLKIPYIPHRGSQIVDWPIKGFTEMQTFFRNLTNYLSKSTVVQRIRVYNRIAFSPKYLLFTNVCISVSLSSVGDGKTNFKENIEATEILKFWIEQVWSSNMKFIRMIWTSIAERGPCIWPCLGNYNHCTSTKIQSICIDGICSNFFVFYRSTVGVVCHFWYKFLDKRMPGRNLTIVLKKVFWDQMICSPIVISTFFLTLGVLEKSSREEIVAEIKSKAWKLYAGKFFTARYCNPFKT